MNHEQYVSRTFIIAFEFILNPHPLKEKPSGGLTYTSIEILVFNKDPILVF